MEVKTICRGESLTKKPCGKEITVWRQTAWDSFIDTITLAGLFNQGRDQIQKKEQCLECWLNDGVHLKLLYNGMLSEEHCDFCKVNYKKNRWIRYSESLFTIASETEKIIE